MLEELNSRLSKVKEQRRKKEKWQNQQVAYQKDLAEKQRTQTVLKEKLNEEEADVEKLSSLSLTNLFVTLIGKKEDRLDKENQDVLVVQLKLNETSKAVKDINASIQQLQENLNGCSDVERDYQEILVEKERLIHDAHSPLTETLFSIEEAATDLQSSLTCHFVR